MLTDADGEVCRAEVRAELDRAPRDPAAAAGQSGEDRGESWGYGQRVRDEEEFHARFAGLTGVLLDDPATFGYCCTQPTDVFQERDGVHRFDRGAELDIERIRAARSARQPWRNGAGSRRRREHGSPGPGAPPPPGPR